MGNFRSSPIAEFNRAATARSSEPARPTAASVPAPASFSTSEKTASKTSRRILTVGNDILLKGEIATCDRLVIEGRVEAKLSEVHTVEIAECGSFKGTAEVEDAEISGIFEGDLIVRNRIVIYASGEVRGNISYGEIEIERGGKLTGQIKTGNNTTSKLKPADATADSKIRKETVAA
jgi:cytoskeletal protein CcmA (bactofilin family)